MLKGPVLQYNQKSDRTFVGAVLLLFGLLFAFGPYLKASGTVPLAVTVLYTLVIGLPMLIAGGWLALGFNKVTIDRRDELVQHSLGLLLPMWTDQYDFSLFERLEVSSEVIPGSDEIEVFFARLIFKDEGRKPLYVSQWQDYETARIESEKMARFLELSIKDYTRSSIGYTSFAELNQRLVERIESSSKKQETLPAIRANLPPAISFDETEGEEHLLVVEPSRLSLRTKVSFSVFIFYWFIIVASFAFRFMHYGALGPIELAIMGLMLLIPIPHLLSTISAACTKELVSVKNGKLIVDRVSLTKAERETLELSEVRDVALHSSSLNKSDGKVMIIGEGEMLSLGGYIEATDRHRLCELLKCLIVDAQR